MEEAPTPNRYINKWKKTGEVQTQNNGINKGKKIERMAQNIQDNLLYQVNFKQEGKRIMVECSNIYKDDENYSYNLMEKEIIQYFGDITNFMNKIDDADNIELKPEKENGVLLLKIIFFDKNMRKEILNLEMKEFKEQEKITIDEDINSLEDAIKAIKLLREENKNIKKKLDTVEQNFNAYKKKMNLNFLYNSFDPFAYKLDDIYNALSSKDIIQNRRDFYLINQGIQHLFKNNIAFFECIYKSNNLNFEWEKFNKKCNNSIYSILIILTQDGERFGAFLNNKVENINKKTNPPKIVFDSFLNEKVYFVFSLDNSQIYYSHNIFGQNAIPRFSIYLENRSLQGCEKPYKNSLNINEYKLVKIPNFNIMELELYSIHLSY